MSPYVYQATVDRWVDGDTVDLIVDLGFKMTTHQRFRLLGVDTPERGEPGFLEATQCAERIHPPGSIVTIKSIKTEKYGRWLVELPEVNAALKQAGLCKLA